MKIVMASHHYPPRYSAGAEQYALRMVRGLMERGHSVEVVCVNSPTAGSAGLTCTTDLDRGYPVHSLDFNLLSAPHPFRWSYRNPEIATWFRDYLMRTRPDLVHINSAYLLSATVPEMAARLGFATVLTLHDYWFICPRITLLRTDGHVCHEPVPAGRCVWCLLSQKRRYRLPDTLVHGLLGTTVTGALGSHVVARALGAEDYLAGVEERRLYLKSVLEIPDVVISPSRFLMDKILAYGIRPRRFLHLPFGLDRQHLQCTGGPAANGTLRIGYLGQIAPHKGVHLLLDAFRRLRCTPEQCRLTLYGNLEAATGAYRRKIQGLAAGHPGIAMAGPYHNQEVGKVLANLDVVVVPSTWYENRPTVILEAFACGVPVVAANLGGMAELVHHGQDGLLFSPGDAGSLAAALQRLVDEPDLRHALRAGIGQVPDTRQEMDHLEHIYLDLVKNVQATVVPTGAANLDATAASLDSEAI